MDIQGLGPKKGTFFVGASDKIQDLDF